MELIELKEKIHKKIEQSDKKILEAIYVLLESSQPYMYELNDIEADELDEDVSNYLAGNTKGYTLEEVKIKARKGA